MDYDVTTRVLRSSKYDFATQDLWWVVGKFGKVNPLTPDLTTLQFINKIDFILKEMCLQYFVFSLYYGGINHR